MKVTFTRQVMAKLGAFQADESREVRELVRRLRSAASPVGKRIVAQLPTYEVSLSHTGVLITYHVQSGTACVETVLSVGGRRRVALGGDVSEP